MIIYARWFSTSIVCAQSIIWSQSALNVKPNKKLSIYYCFIFPNICPNYKYILKYRQVRSLVVGASCECHRTPRIEQPYVDYPNCQFVTVTRWLWPSYTDQTVLRCVVLAEARMTADRHVKAGLQNILKCWFQVYY